MVTSGDPTMLPPMARLISSSGMCRDVEGTAMLDYLAFLPEADFFFVEAMRVAGLADAWGAGVTFPST